MLVADSGALRSDREPYLAAMLVVLAAVNIELGRWVEGRARTGQRPHKTLSVWALTTVLSIDPVWLLAVVPAGYARAWFRGIRVPVWKWVGSAAFVTLAGLAAAALLARWPAGFALDPAAGWPAVGVLTMAVGVFLLVESAPFP